MTTQFQIGQVTRNYPLPNGEFDIFKIEKLDHGNVIVRNMDEKFISETETWNHEQLELYEFKNSSGKIKLGDSVTVPGFEGVWTVLHYQQSPRNMEEEWCACLSKPSTEDEYRKQLFWSAHNIVKV